MKKFCETSGTSDCALCTISSLGKLEWKFDQNFWQNPGRSFRSLDMEISLWTRLHHRNRILKRKSISFQTPNKTCLECFPCCYSPFCFFKGMSLLIEFQRESVLALSRETSPKHICCPKFSFAGSFFGNLMRMKMLECGRLGWHILWWRNLSETTSATCASWSPVAPTLSILATTFLLLANSQQHGQCHFFVQVWLVCKSLLWKTRPPTRGSFISQRCIIWKFDPLPNLEVIWHKKVLKVRSQACPGILVTKKHKKYFKPVEIIYKHY